jgi:YggT family protein
MQSLFHLIYTVIDLYVWLLIASAVLSWLVMFNVINTRNRAVMVIGDFLYRITEPALRPIRRYMPNLGGIDLSPVVLILLLFLVRDLIAEYTFAARPIRGMYGSVWPGGLEQLAGMLIG